MNIIAKNKTLEVISDILEYFYSKCDDNYFPVILNEGRLFEGKDRRDLYLKVFANPKGNKIAKTWMVSNLADGFSDGAFNFAVTYRYNFSDIVGINSYLLAYSNISLVEQKSKDVLEMEYFDGQKRLGNFKILKQDEKSTFLFFPAIEFMTDVSRYDDEKFDLCIDCEFRQYIDDLSPDIFGDKEIDNGFVNLIYNENSPIFDDKNVPKKMYWLRFSIKLDLKKMKCAYKAEKHKTIDRRYKVVDLETSTFRALNLSNYNDDMNAGVLMFSFDAVDVLKKYFYFYALELIPKNEDSKGCLYDYLEDRITFWEGEFNSNLPIEIREELLKYNLFDKTKNYISQAMFDWQLMSKWDIKDKLLPSQKLARLVADKDLNKAKESQIDFFPPRNVFEFSDFILKFMKLYNLEISLLPITLANKTKLSKIIDNDFTFETNKDLFNNYEGLCLLFLKVVFNE